MTESAQWKRLQMRDGRTKNNHKMRPTKERNNETTTVVDDGESGRLIMAQRREFFFLAAASRREAEAWTNQAIRTFLDVEPQRIKMR
jgi:hypothetical protein